MRFLKIIIALLLVGAIGLGIAYFMFSSEIETSVPHTAAGQIINVPAGSTPDSICTLLESKGVVKHALPLKLYIRLSHSGAVLKAGDYVFDSPISPKEVLQKLESGEQGALKLTVVEGWNRWDIASAMQKIPTLKLRSTEEVLHLISDTSAIKDLDPSATSLEGYMFPNTYFLLSNNTPKDVIAQMTTQFKDVWQKELKPLFAVQSMSVHDIVTIASIVETEAKKKEERPIIASVIYNRLSKKMPLGMDSTIVYAAKIAGKWRNDGKVYQSDIDRVSPYNTRKIVGLPIGPVGCPGLLSLKAALKPAYTNYIYYVRNPDDNSGSHNFYSTEADFERGVQALRDWEKKRDSQNAHAVRAGH
ncbi:MAG TPA: endolytic transglycosylase MltG [Oculatellaceae cyanobacterium]